MLILEGYSINELIQENSQFSLYKGKRKADGENVIVKVCHSEQPNLSDLVALQHEYEILKQVNLSGIIRVHELLKFQNQLVLILENIDGISLKQILAKGRLPLSLFFKIAVQLVDIVGELHAHHIIHKYINPNNILINEKTLNVKLADFSVSSELFQESQSHHTLTNKEALLAYVSPEQTGRLNRAIDYRSDFYSLGATFYEMLTGIAPFESDDPMELIHSHLTLEPEALTSINPDIPLTVEEIIKKLLSKTPEARYQSSAGLKTDLLRCQVQWDKSGKISPFPIGHKDLQDHLIVSQKLYGREEQMETLLGKFKNVSENKTELVFVSGYSGIGKTSLVKELYRPIVNQRGYFLSGKFDQLQRATPYSAIIEAFSGFVRKCLLESETDLELLRSSLLSSLGNNGQVIINIIPDIELIIGPQPPIPDLSLVDTQNRLTTTFLSFVRKLIQLKHPVVLFLDDLQWIDSASLKLLHLLTDDNELQGLLIIGAYRDNEVSVNHPLIQMQQQLKANNIPFSNIVLSPLKEMDILHLVSDTLAADESSIRELVHIIMEKTHGNPFFINEFIKKLYNDNLLKFSYSHRCWEWDAKQIKELSITDNVIDLLMSRIDKLPEKTQKLLELAACIGHVFDLVTLSTICEQSLSETAKQMLEATKTSFILPVNDNYYLLEIIAAGNIQLDRIQSEIKYAFIHDKIQQAAYQKIHDKTRHKVHLKIGRLLLKENSELEKDDQLFEVLNHFNYSLDDINDINEIIQLSELNLVAGRKAKMSGAYQSAKEYVSAGLKLLEKIEHAKKPGLVFALTKELASCQYQTGEFEKAESNFNQLLIEAPDPLSRIEIAKLHCEMLSTLNRHDEGITLGLKVLSTVNVNISRNPNLLHILLAIVKIKMLVGKRKIEDINFEVMDKEIDHTISGLVSQLINSAFVTNPNLFILLASVSVQLSLRHGYTSSTVFSLAVYAFAIMHGLNWYKEGLSFYYLQEKLAKQYPQLSFEGKNEFIVGTFILPWILPFNKSAEVLRSGYHDSYESGDLVYSNYCNLLILYLGLTVISNTITEARLNYQNAITFIKKINAKDFILIAEFCGEMIQALDHNIFSIAQVKKYERNILDCKNNTEISIFYCIATKMCYLFGYNEEAIQYGRLHDKYAEFTLGIVITVEGYFYSAMSMLKAGAVEYKQHKRSLKKIRTKLARWSSWCPGNFQTYLLLFDAEAARVKHDVSTAIACYSSAIHLAASNNKYHLAALGNELLGQLYDELRLSDAASLYHKLADEAYMHLGYTSIIKDTQSLIAMKLQNTDFTDRNLPYIDILSLMKSSQAISSEIELNKLLHKLLVILLQNAGAHRVVLLSCENKNWYVEAEGTATEQKILHSPVSENESRNDLPISVIRYVWRTQKPILIQTQHELDNYAENDEYLRQFQPQSILAIPVFYHGEFSSILFLENRSVSMAFKSEHVQILQTLSAQAAISLQNAKLYHQATHDSLTGLANRSQLYQSFNHVTSHSTNTIAILLIDLDYFKIINDTLGHHVGDKVLLHVAKLLTSCVGDGNTAARLGGDEFVAMIEYRNIEEVTNTAIKFIYDLIVPIQIEGHDINLTGSIGISLYPNHADNISELLKHADIALYRVKAMGKNQFQYYHHSLQNQIREEYIKEIELREATEKNQFSIYYQPVYSASTNLVTHFEALLRWNHPEKGIIPADQFISTAEKAGLIIPIGRWVLITVLEQIQQWISSGITPLPVAVNVSGLQFKMQDVNHMVQDALDQYKIDVSLLELEFTESVYIEYTEKVLNDIAKLKSMGVKLTLDDFGTYYSSVAYLRQNYVNKIKIDKSFVNGINRGNNDNELIVGIINLAHSLNISVIAEGVETREQLEFLVKNGIDEIQGYYMSLPLSAEQCGKLLRTQTRVF